MSFITGLFKKKKIEVGDHEMVWRREDGSDYPTGNDTSAEHDAFRTEPTEEVSHNPYRREEPEDTTHQYHSETDAHSSPSDYGGFKPTSAIATPPWAVNLNEHKEIRSPYVDITPMNPEKPYNIRKRLNSRVNNQPLDFYDSSPPNQSERDMQSPYGRHPNSGLTSSEGPDKARASSWVRSTRANEFSAKNKEFYEIEARINRKMMEEDQAAKGPSIRTNIFNPDAQLDRPTVPSFNVYQRAPKEPPNGRQQANNFAVFAPEITARTGFDKRKIFELSGDASGDTAKVKKEIHPVDAFRTGPGDLTNMKVLEEALNSEKTVEELISDLNGKQSELNATEQRYFQMVKDPRNLTVLETDLRDVVAQIEKEKAKGRSLGSEAKKLSEEMALCGQRVAQRSLEVEQKRAGLPQSLGERENVLREIELLKGKIKREKEALGNYGESLQQKTRMWKEQSEKAMNAELESIKMNVDNFTDDLVRELAYFEGKQRGR